VLCHRRGRLVVSGGEMVSLCCWQFTQEEAEEEAEEERLALLLPVGSSASISFMR
jgi:hypothetical protein